MTGGFAISCRGARGGYSLAVALLVALLGDACASRGAASFAPLSADRAARAIEVWKEAVARAGEEADVNLLYDAKLSQGLLHSDGTLAVRLRGERVDGALAGPFGAPIATYENGELRGEKLQPVRLPPRQLRAILAGAWPGTAPAVVGERGSEVLLRWSGDDAADGVFDVARGELRSLRVARSDADLEAQFLGSRNPWPDRIEIDEKRTGSKLRLKLISREATP